MFLLPWGLAPWWRGLENLWLMKQLSAVAKRPEERVVVWGLK
ncbi:MAG TPA: hypothetical protein VFR47_15965 [Anaerolineales bacterium]|nr:hypothetical protein [Anaerolineales bacterium]